MEKNFKRKFRERDEITKMKISNSLRNRPKSAEHCRAISQGLKKYWEGVPSMKNNELNKIKEMTKNDLGRTIIDELKLCYEDNNNTSIITINEDELDDFFTDDGKDYINILEKAFINEEIGVAIKVVGYPISSLDDKLYEFIYERFEYVVDEWEIEDYIWLQEQDDDEYNKMKITPYANLNIASENMFHLGKNGKLYTSVDCGDEWYEYHEITEEQFQKIRTEALNNLIENN